MAPEENRVHRPPSRASQRTMLAISITVYAYMLFGGLVVLVFGFVRGVNAARIEFGPTVRTTASEISKDVENGALKVYYAFQPPGAVAMYVGIEDVSPDEYAAAESGSPIDIEYLPSDANTNWVVGRSPFLTEAIAAVFGLVMGVFVLVVSQWRFGPGGLSWFRRRRAMPKSD
jgi:hypothetical protein